jgi:hypothetical protein
MSDAAGGPYVQAALICERVLDEKDGVLSIIRVIDRITITTSGAAPPKEMPPTTVTFVLLVTLKSGDFRGRFTLRMIPTTPSGKKLNEMSAGILLEGEERGINVVMNAQFQAQEEGLYWFDVVFEEQLLTRIPLRLIYQRLAQSGRPDGV